MGQSCSQPYKGVPSVSLENFLENPYDRKFIDYAKFQVYALKRNSNIKWIPYGIDSFANDVAADAIELTKHDLLKPGSPFRNEDAYSFKKFFWARINKTLHARLKAMVPPPNIVSFNEGIGRIYENAPGREWSESSSAERDCNPKKGLSIHDVPLYSGSREKEQILQDSYDEKMRQVEKIRQMVSNLSPDHQRIFNLRFGFNLTDEDFLKMEEIRQHGHVKEPYTMVAVEEMGISAQTARKRLHDILAYLKKELTRDGTMGAYKSLTAIPGLTEWKVEPRSSYEEIGIENLSESECLELCVELLY